MNVFQRVNVAIFQKTLHHSIGIWSGIFGFLIFLSEAQTQIFIDCRDSETHQNGSQDFFFCKGLTVIFFHTDSGV